MSLYLGAKESGCSDEDCSLFVRIGYNLGMAFQIIDDILDFKGQPEKTGKPSYGHDIKEGVFTLPVILSLQKDNEKLRKLLTKRPYSERSIKKIITLIEESDSVNEAAEEASRYTDRALRELERLQAGYTRDQLFLLTKNLLKRDY
jgi:heptaprenyl diphosphate synthase